MKFFKYQSLGNDFIILDWLKKSPDLINKSLSSTNWPQFVKNSCTRNSGVGADGLLLILKNKKPFSPETFVFNANGEKAEVCFNGVRCIALHLFNYHHFPQKFNIYMGKKKIECIISIAKNNSLEITTKVDTVHSIKTKTISIPKLGKFSGHVVDVGNPHFIVRKKINPEWIKQYGPMFESHKAFPNKINTEFIWQEKGETHFNMLVYERGCGPTYACSSGAASVIRILHKTKKIQTQEQIKLKMEGGTLISWLDKDLNIYQQAPAKIVFEGYLDQIP